MKIIEVLFQNYFTKVTSQHTDSEGNSSYLIQRGRVGFKTILLTMKSDYHVCRAQNKVFPNKIGIKRLIAKPSSLQHVLNVSF